MQRHCLHHFEEEPPLEAQVVSVSIENAGAVGGGVENKSLIIF